MTSASNKKEESQYWDHIRQYGFPPHTEDDNIRLLIYLYPAAFALIGLSALYSFYRYYPAQYDLAGVGVGALLGAVGLAWFIRGRLKESLWFQKVPIRQWNEEAIMNALKNHFTLDYVKIEKKYGVIYARTKWSGSSWGDLLTLVKDGDSVWINSKPASARQAISFFKDRKNIKALKMLLSQF